MKLARLKVRCFFVFSFTPSIPSLPIVHLFDHNLKKVSFEAWCIQGLLMIVLKCRISYILTCMVHAYENSHIRTSHKTIVVPRNREYLNVIMTENDIYPCLKVV